MSNTIDTKVVSMKFDNKDFEAKVKQTQNSVKGLKENLKFKQVDMKLNNSTFEANAKQTISTTSKLKEALKFGSVGAGLSKLGNSIKAVPFNAMTKGIDAVNVKFSAMQVVANTALSNITTSAMQAGQKIVNALTIDPAKTGFEEYELKINAIQTIMSNVGKETGLDDIKATLNELNLYSDKTIYNFANMTDAIGRFTAAGVDLDTSARSIQGIANLAAASGVNAQKAGHAMQFMSRAFSSGYMTLEDWNIMEDAGIGTMKFKNALIETAKEHGIAVDKIIRDNGSFRLSLKDAWVDTEVLSDTLKKFTTEGAKEYGDAMVKSGKYTQAQADALNEEALMMEHAATKIKTLTGLREASMEVITGSFGKAYEYIIGDIGEATELLTATGAVISNILSTIGGAINGVLLEWNKLGGRTELITALKNVFDALLSVVLPIKEAFIDFFPAITGQNLLDLTKKFTEFTKTLKLSEEAQANLKVVTTAMLNIFKMLGKTLSLLKTPLAILGGAIGGLIVIVSKFIVALSKAVNAGQAMEFLSETLSKVIEKTKNIIKTAIKYIVDNFDLFIEKVQATWIKVKEFFVNLGEVASKHLKPFIDILKQVGTVVGDVFGGIFSSVSKFLSPIGDVFSGVADKAKNMYKNLAEDFNLPTFGLFSKDVHAAGEAMRDTAAIASEFGVETSDALYEVSDNEALDNFRNSLEETKNTFRTFGAAVVDFFKPLADSIVGFFSKIVNSLSMESFMEIVNFILSGAFITKVVQLIESLKGPLDGISDLLETFNEGFGEVFEGVKDTLEAYQKDLKANVLIKIAGAIAIMTASLWLLSKINPDRILSAVTGLGSVVGVLSGAMAALKLLGADIVGVGKTVMMLIGISTSLTILGSALKKLTDLSWGELAKGLAGVATLMTTMVAAVKAIGKNGPLIVSGMTQTIAMSVAINILARAARKLSDLSWGELAKGLTGVSTLMGSVSLFLSNTKFQPGAMAASVAMNVFASAISAMVEPAKEMAALTWEEIGKGLTSIGSLLTGISLFFTNTKFSPGANAAAISLNIFAEAMERMTKPALFFARMSWESMYKGLSGVGAMLAGISLFLNNTTFEPRAIASAVGITIFANALKMLIEPMKFMSKLSWNELAKGLTGLGISMMAIALALDNMPKNMLNIGTGLLAVSGALKVIVGIVSDLGGMSLDVLAKGLGSLAISLTSLSLALRGMGNTEGSATALIGAAIAIKLLAPAINMLGNLPLEVIAVGLGTIIGTLTAFAGTAKLLSAAVPAMNALSSSLMGLAGAMLTISGSVVIGGLGLLFFASALAIIGTLGAPAVAAITGVLTGIIDAINEKIPAIAEALVEGFTTIVEGLAESATALGEGLVTIITTIIDVIIQSASSLGDGLFRLVDEAMNILMKYTEPILSKLVDWIIVVLNLLRDKIPELVPVAVDVITSFLTEVGKALQNVDTTSLMNGIIGVSILAFMMKVLSQIKGKVALGAVKGVAYVGLVVAAITGILAALGAIQQIPGLGWLVDEGGELLEGVGTALGKLIGGLLGGVAAGVVSTLPTMAEDLSLFMEKLKPFIEGAKVITPESMAGVKVLAETILLLTAANVLDGIASWVTGSSSMKKFAEDLAILGPSLKKYADSIAGMDAEVVTNSANAAKALTEMANNLPNEGGLAAIIMGENDINKFADQLVLFGPKLKQYADSVKGLDAGIVENSVNAAKALSGLAENLPNSGGVLSWFTGENDMATFGNDLVIFGNSMKLYSESVATLTKEKIDLSIDAVDRIVTMAGNISNEIYAKLTNLSGGIKALGAGLLDLWNKTSQIDNRKFDQAIRNISNLATAISSIGIINEEDVKSFSDALKEIADTGVDGIIETFENSEDDVAEAAGDMFKNVSKGVIAESETLITNTSKMITALLGLFREANEKFVSVGQVLIENVSTGMNSKKQILQNEVSEIIGSVSTTIIAYTPKFNSNGQSLMDRLISGVKAKENTFISTIRRIMETAIEEIDRTFPEFRKSGIEIINAIIEGLDNNTDSLSKTLSNILDDLLIETESNSKTFINVGENIASLISEGIENEYDKISTSLTKTMIDATDEIDSDTNIIRAFKNVGKYLIEHLVEGIENAEREAINAAKDVVESITDIMSNIDMTIDTGNISGYSALSNNDRSTNNIESNNVDAQLANGISAGNMTVTAMQYMLDELVITIEMMYDTFEYCGEKIIKKINSGMNKEKYSLTTTIRTIMNEITTSITSSNNSFRTLGESLIAQTIEGLKNKEEPLKKTLLVIMDSIIEAVEDTLENIKDTGMKIGLAMMEGIHRSESRVAMAARGVVSAVREQILRLRSQFETAGVDMMNGLTTGVDREGRETAKSVRFMLNTIRDTFREYKERFESDGYGLVRSFASGLRKYGQEDSKNGIKEMLIEPILYFTNSMYNSHKKFYKTGQDLIIQFISGIKKEMPNVTKTIKEVEERLEKFHNVSITHPKPKPDKDEQSEEDKINDLLGNVVDGELEFPVEIINRTISTFTLGFDDSRDEVFDASAALIMYAVDGVRSVSPEFEKVMSELIDAILELLTESYYDFENAGDNIVRQIIMAINKNEDSTVEAMGALMVRLLDAVRDKEYDFQYAGENLMYNLSDGIEDSSSYVTNAISDLVDTMLYKIEEFTGGMVAAGGTIVKSIADGITTAAHQEIRRAMDRVYEELERAFREHKSEMKQHGMDMMTEFAEGIQSKDNDPFREMVRNVTSFINFAVSATYEAKKAGEAFPTMYSQGIRQTAFAVEQAFDSLIAMIPTEEELSPPSPSPMSLAGLRQSFLKAVDMVAEDIDTTITITPIIDMSVVDKQSTGVTAKLKSIFNGGTGYGLSSSIANKQASLGGNIVTNNTENKYEFIQNNYSPKTLSRLDIYRQTKRQMDSFKEATS